MTRGMWQWTTVRGLSKERCGCDTWQLVDSCPYGQQRQAIRTWWNLADAWPYFPSDMSCSPCALRLQARWR